MNLDPIGRAIHTHRPYKDRQLLYRSTFRPRKLLPLRPRSLSFTGQHSSNYGNNTGMPVENHQTMPPTMTMTNGLQESMQPQVDPTKSCVNDPIFRNIVDTFQKTLGKQCLIMNEQELLVLTYKPTESLRLKYQDHRHEVIEFCEGLGIWTTQLCPQEKDDNLENWLDVLVLRSCWWLDMTRWTANSKMDVIRVSGRYGLQKDYHQQLNPLFRLANSFSNMQLNIFEVSLMSAYCLLLGTDSFITGQSATAKLRANVLRLLRAYEDEHYKDKKLRFGQILANLCALHQIVVLF